MTSFQQKYAPTRLATYQFEDSNVHATISDYAAGLRSGALLLHGPNGDLAFTVEFGFQPAQDGRVCIAQ